MTKKILITGATDGIGFETAKILATQSHHLLLSGRNPAKLEKAVEQITQASGNVQIETFVADLSDLKDAARLADDVLSKHDKIDVLINNAGIFKTSEPRTADGLDVRFVVNTLAPYLLTRLLQPAMNKDSRVVNVSSAAQAPVDLNALKGHGEMTDSSAYAQSKLAITMWTNHLNSRHLDKAPMMVSVNPGSLLASKMVKQAYGIPGSDLSVGADILTRAATSDEFAQAGGKYYDNDSKRFANPHPDAMNSQKCEAVVSTIEGILQAI